MPQKEDSSFILKFKKIWTKIVQPKILFAKETYHLAFYNRKGQIEWQISHSVWRGVILSDLAILFGSHWPGFTELPKREGAQRGVTLTKPNHLGYFLLFKTKFRGPLKEVQKDK